MWSENETVSLNFMRTLMKKIYLVLLHLPFDVEETTDAFQGVGHESHLRHAHAERCGFHDLEKCNFNKFEVSNTNYIIT